MPLRGRGWVFTLNNYTDEEIAFINEVDCKYLVYGKEVGESGTPHLQGFVYFTSQRTFRSVKAKLGGRVHIDKQRGSVLQAIDYCCKDGEVFEKGDRPSTTGGRPREEERIIQNARLRDASLNELVETGEISIFDVRKLKNARTDLKQENSMFTAEGTRGVWLWGKPGVGKSHRVRETFPGLFIKQQSKWWCGYEGEAVVLLDDFDTDCLGHYLKIWGDKWSCKGEIKGGTVALRHTTFYVTSNYPPMHFWPNDSSMREAITRRFNVIEVMDQFTDYDLRPDANRAREAEGALQPEGENILLGSGLGVPRV